MLSPLPFVCQHKSMQKHSCIYVCKYKHVHVLGANKVNMQVSGCSLHEWLFWCIHFVDWFKTKHRWQGQSKDSSWTTQRTCFYLTLELSRNHGILAKGRREFWSWKFKTGLDSCLNHTLDLVKKDDCDEEPSEGRGWEFLRWLPFLVARVLKLPFWWKLLDIIILLLWTLHSWWIFSSKEWDTDTRVLPEYQSIIILFYYLKYKRFWNGLLRLYRLRIQTAILRSDCTMQNFACCSFLKLLVTCISYSLCNVSELRLCPL